MDNGHYSDTLLANCQVNTITKHLEEYVTFLLFFVDLINYFFQFLYVLRQDEFFIFRFAKYGMPAKYSNAEYTSMRSSAVSGQSICCL